MKPRSEVGRDEAALQLKGSGLEGCLGSSIDDKKTCSVGEMKLNLGFGKEQSLAPVSLSA